MNLFPRRAIAIVVAALTCSICAAEEATASKSSIDAVLELARSSLSGGQVDKVEVLKNAMILLAEVKGSEHAEESLSQLMEMTINALEETGTSTATCGTSEAAEEIFTVYADRHARRLEETVHDYDCMEREFDVSAEDFDSAEAAQVFHKCRLLVLRNVLPKETVLQYRKKYENYLYAIHKGKIDRTKTKTTDSRVLDIVQNRGPKRHDVMLPRWLGGKELYHHPNLLNIMKHHMVLGADMVLSQVGSVISESGAPNMHWHDDLGYLWTGDSFDLSGIAGHDLPPFAASAFVPLVENATYAHGPTEFCMGSSHVSGVGAHAPALNATLVAEGSPFQKMQSFRTKMDACPPDHWRVPLVNMGDVIIFDYQITHRGGPNESSESRALIYGLYSRFWFRDSNFDNTYSDSSEQIEKDNWGEGMRYALVDESDIEDSPLAESSIQHLEKFAGLDWATEYTGTIELPFTNHNVEDAYLYVNGEYATYVAPKQQLVLTLETGDEISVLNSAKALIRKWTVGSDGQEIILVDRSTSV